MITHQKVRAVLKKGGFSVGCWGKLNRVGNSDFWGGVLEVKNISEYKIIKYLKYSKKSIWETEVLGVRIRIFNTDKIKGDLENYKKRLIDFLKLNFENVKINKYNNEIIEVIK